MNTIADKIVPGVINTITPDKLPQGTIPAGEHDKIVVLQVDENGKYKYKALPPEAFQGIQGKPGENAISNINARGVWDGDTLYAKNDLVMCQDGNAYISIIDDNIGIYPPNYTNAWTKFVARGANGFGIIGSNIQYQVGSSGTSQPTGTWTDFVPETTGANQFLWTRTQFIREVIDGTVLETAYSVGRIGIDAPQVRFQYSTDGVSNWTDVFNNTHVFLRTSVDDGNTWSEAMRFRGLDSAVLSVNGRTGNVTGLAEAVHSHTHIINQNHNEIGDDILTWLIGKAPGFYVCTAETAITSNLPAFGGFFVTGHIGNDNFITLEATTLWGSVVPRKFFNVCDSGIWRGWIDITDGGSGSDVTQERGVWIPEVRNSSGNLIPVLITWGDWRRVGNTVFANFQLMLQNPNDGDSSITINGLPRVVRVGTVATGVAASFNNNIGIINAFCTAGMSSIDLFSHDIIHLANISIAYEIE